MNAPPNQFRVLHVLDHSWPILSGYAVRSTSIMRAERELGESVAAVTSPSHQLDEPEARDTAFEDIPICRTHLSGLSGAAIRKRLPLLREAATVRLLRNRILALAASERFDIIHAHSPSICGLAALRAARAGGIPFVYEIRGFWEDSAVDHGKLSPDSWQYKMRQRLETYVAHHANAVVGIAANIVSEMERRGIARSKLFHVPNGVDARSFEPMPRDEALAASLGIASGEPTLGFIGSMWRFEGLSWLVSSLAEISGGKMPFRLVLVGHGEEERAVRKIIDERRISSSVLFLGRVPHDQVRRYYSIMDAMVYPRRRVRLTEHVTPLKPLEAMAMAKPVLASRVGGLVELVDDGKTGILFDPDDPQDLYRAATELLMNPELRREIGERARQVILREKDWPVVGAAYGRVYRYATENCSARVCRKKAPV